ncbi:MAG TPA: ASCH domain-containing protein [Staphylococcus sp.]|nr:ASCH domain-containing protein [Staphylococcus sp.]
MQEWSVYIIEHSMKLNNEPFQSVKNGIKTVEIRLNDEKRQKVKNGDTIKFNNLETNEVVKVVVTETVMYPSFQVLLNQYTNREIGAKEGDQLSQKLAAIYQIYSQTDELEFGALAIKMHLAN